VDSLSDKLVLDALYGFLRDEGFNVRYEYVGMGPENISLRGGMDQVDVSVRGGNLLVWMMSNPQWCLYELGDPECFEKLVGLLLTAGCEQNPGCWRKPDASESDAGGD